MRHLCRTVVATLLLSGGAIGMTGPVQAKPAAASASTAPKAHESAIAEARKTGEAVPVPSLTDEYSSTSANPDGTLTLLASSNPQRVRKDDTWVPIDTSLVRRGNGSYGPRATLTLVSVSGGGDTALVSMTEGHNALKFTWPEKLPEPTVSGSTATYADVMPDVDLQIIADPTGYSSIFVVKTPEAAANPGVRSIDMGLSGTNVTISETANGGAEAVDIKTGKQVFHTDTALMWDSSPTQETTAARTSSKRSSATEAPGGQTPAVPGPENMGGKRAQVKIDISKGKQTLVLDEALLTSKNTKFPIYVDPFWSGGSKGSQLDWARISSNGWNVYNATSKTGATPGPRQSPK